ncbi:DUF4350 domain-containing protein [Parafrigoribacterium soli]|uniref:DUF4350 domain-containing protein n=1 Tax=Parafrigoribacterium soli TaxID=3144663 RepID=UPI0032EE2162
MTATTSVSTPSAVVSTPTVRAATKRYLFWILAVVFVVLLAVVTLVIRGSAAPTGTPLSPTNAAPPGSRAVAEVLKQHGVNVVPTETLKTTRALLTSHPDATVLLYDPDSRLDARQLRSLASLGEKMVVVTPNFSQLRTLAPSVAQAGAAKSGTLKARCALPAAVKAGAISGGGNGYRIVGGASDAVGCFPSGKGIHSLISLESGGQRLTILGADQVLANETVPSKGNAALALNLLGSTSTLVWYLPSIDDVAVSGLPTIAELTPPWVSSVALLLIITAIAAAFWRGRRLGPLVIENLPVTVRANETMEGRARLYQRNSTRLRALDALRIGTIGRLARLCGMPRAASTTEVIDRVCAVTGRDRSRIAPLLVDAVPAHDGDLIRLSDELLELERAVAAAVAG